MTSTLKNPLSKEGCNFCGEEPVAHGIHGLEDVSLCGDCRNKFAYLRYLADPTVGRVLGFKCRSCGFECDVPGTVTFDKESNAFLTKVDSAHRFCQKCGTTTRHADSDEENKA